MVTHFIYITSAELAFCTKVLECGTFGGLSEARTCKPQLLGRNNVPWSHIHAVLQVTYIPYGFCMRLASYWDDEAPWLLASANAWKLPNKNVESVGIMLLLLEERLGQMGLLISTNHRVTSMTSCVRISFLSLFIPQWF